MRGQLRVPIAIASGIALGIAGTEGYQYVSAPAESTAVPNYLSSAQALGEQAIKEYGELPENRRSIGEGNSLVALLSRTEDGVQVAFSATFNSASGNGLPAGAINSVNVLVSQGNFNSPNFATLENLGVEVEPDNELKAYCYSGESYNPSGSPAEYNQATVSHNNGEQTINYASANAIVVRQLLIAGVVEQDLAHDRVNPAKFADICGQAFQNEPLAAITVAGLNNSRPTV
jgi:hypothetical protein